MPKRGLNITEAVEIFQNLPSDDESEESSHSEMEVIISNLSSRQNTDVDDAGRSDINLPGPLHVSNVI